MNPDKRRGPTTAAADLSALSEAFSGVQRLGEPQRRPSNPSSGVSARPVAAPAPPPTPAPLPLDEDALLREAMSGVRRLGASRAAPLARASASTAPVPVDRIADLTRQVAATQDSLLRVQAELVDVQASLRASQAERARLTDLATAANAVLAAPELPAPVGLRELGADRGLIGEDELLSALRALIDARRAGPLLDHLVARDAAGLERYFGERLILVSEGETAPVGRVAVVVPVARSELREDSSIRRALSLFSTTCLIHGRLKVAFVGGSPASRRQIKEGVDRRIDVRFVEASPERNQRVEGADLVIVWGALQVDPAVIQSFPEAIVVHQRDLTRMLEAASDRLANAQPA